MTVHQDKGPQCDCFPYARVPLDTVWLVAHINLPRKKKNEMIFTFLEELCVPSGYCKPANPVQISPMLALLSE